MELKFQETSTYILLDCDIWTIHFNGRHYSYLDIIFTMKRVYTHRYYLYLMKLSFFLSGFSFIAFLVQLIFDFISFDTLKESLHADASSKLEAFGFASLFFFLLAYTINFGRGSSTKEIDLADKN